MLYLDSSVLVKRYGREAGAEALNARLAAGDRVFTSALSYAEVHSALARKYREGGIKTDEMERVKEKFVYDWIFSFNVLEVDTRIMSALPDLVLRFPLKASDAVHLSAALWLRDMCRLVPEFAAGDVLLEFGVSDKALARIASGCGLNVFNPESSP